MAFFQSKPNLPAADKAKVEFRLQQIADCIGFDRFQLPVRSLTELVSLSETDNSVEGIVAFAGKHLSHDVNALQVIVAPQELEKCGGGG